MKTCRQCGLEILIGENGLCAECVSLRDHPDATSKMTKLGKAPFQDLKQIDEVDRFKVIANHISDNPGKAIVVLVESDAPNKSKGDRYIAGVKSLVPKVGVQRCAGAVSGTETLIFKL